MTNPPYTRFDNSSACLSVATMRLVCFRIDVRCIVGTGQDRAEPWH